MARLIKGVHHIALKCNGMEEFNKTIHFYRDLLGMEEVRSWGEGTGSAVMLNNGNSVMEIMANAEDAPGEGAIRHIALVTDDVDECCRIVSEAGYEVYIQPKDIDFQTKEPYKARIAFCYGPVNEEIEFFCEMN